MVEIVCCVEYGHSILETESNCVSLGVREVGS
jgi:hypothetical protein